MRDAAWGVLMALCVALVPITLQVVLQQSEMGHSISGKYLLVGLLASGACTTAPLLLGNKGPTTHLVAGTALLPVKLLFFGIFASAYFFAVIGLDDVSGVGAGIGESLEGGLQPLLYIAISIVAYKRWAKRTGSAMRPLSAKIKLGALLIALGLFVLGLTITMFNQDSMASSMVPHTSNVLIILCAVIGAAGSTFSIWIVRLLVRHHDANIGYVVKYRYGGIALVYLGLASWHGSWRSLDIFTGVLVYLIGVVLVNGALVALTRIKSSYSVPAAIALTPLIALGIELGLNKTGALNSRMPIESPALWLGVFVTGIGVLLLQSEESSSEIWKS